jgi:hypothetical protein
MPRLRFLHLQNPFPAESLLAERLGEAMPTLEHVGLGRVFWRIVKYVGDDGEDGLKVGRIQLSKMMMEVTRDDEWYDERWLMEWHDDLD